MSTQTWRPDTCECVIEEEVVDGEITPGDIISKCSAHSGVADGDLYGVLIGNTDGENKRKNLIHAYLVNELGIEFGETIEYVWSFSGTGADRVLSVEVVGGNLTQDQKDQVQDYADTTFGAGKVEVI